MNINKKLTKPIFEKQRRSYSMIDEKSLTKSKKQLNETFIGNSPGE